MATETLVCIGTKKTHKWTREATRGRKPQYCPKHPNPNAVVIGPKAGPKTLHCELGNHDWVREPTRGRVPVNCPQHKPLIVAPPTVTMNKAGNAVTTLHCELGDHDWERESTRGRKPRNCPKHATSAAPRSVPVNVVEGSQEGDPAPKRGRGRPKLYETDEEREAAALAKSTEKVNRLEQGLMARGTHISQQAPYILYKKVGEVKSRVKGRAPKVTWEKVTEHSPLQRELYLNEHEKDFLEKKYRYEREGVPVIH